jgi:RNA polymerase sigma factor (sigma-70 family)
MAAFCPSVYWLAGLLVFSERAIMASVTDRTAQLQICLDRLQTGDEAARQELLTQACERLQRLTRKMLRGDARVKRWEQTDDVFQNSALRLYRALQDVRPGSVQEFFRLAAVQIRRELIDLARHYYGPEGHGAHSLTDHGKADADGTLRSAAEPDDLTHEPARLAMWQEFHQQVETLPNDQREVFDLLWYQDLTEAEAAALLDVSVRTIQRRWQSARLRLHRVLKEEP